MKNTVKISLFILVQLTFLCSVQAQFGIKTPKIKVDKPSISKGKADSNSGDSGSGLNVPKSDPSGLFQKVSDDPSAKHHRSKCVETLELLEAEYAKEMVNYSTISSHIKTIEKSLASAHKLEPMMSSEKFDARYKESTTPINADLLIIDEMKEIELTISNDYDLYGTYGSIDPISYRKPRGNNAIGPCYCREWDKTWTYSDYTSLVAQYKDLGTKVPKYTNEKIEKDLSELEACMINGDKYASGEGPTKIMEEVNEFNKEERALNPENVIAECDKYLVALDLIKTDPSLNFQASTLEVLANTKSELEKIKTSAELYISSGDFKKHLVQVQVEKAKLVFMPKAATQDANFEAKAKAYIKGSEYAAYLEKMVESAVGSTLRAVSVTNGYYVRKNDLGIPKWKHKEIVVAYKDVDGVCQMASVYASYTYEGGGVYASVPIWGADSPTQMACENVNK